VGVAQCRLHLRLRPERREGPRRAVPGRRLTAPTSLFFSSTGPAHHAGLICSSGKLTRPCVSGANLTNYFTFVALPCRGAPGPPRRELVLEVTSVGETSTMVERALMACHHLEVERIRPRLVLNRTLPSPPNPCCSAP